MRRVLCHAVLCVPNDTNRVDVPDCKLQTQQARRLNGLIWCVLDSSINGIVHRLALCLSPYGFYLCVCKCMWNMCDNVWKEQCSNLRVYDSTFVSAGEIERVQERQRHKLGLHADRWDKHSNFLSIPSTKYTPFPKPNTPLVIYILLDYFCLNIINKPQQQNTRIRIGFL